MGARLNRALLAAHRNASPPSTIVCSIGVVGDELPGSWWRGSGDTDATPVPHATIRGDTACRAPLLEQLILAPRQFSPTSSSPVGTRARSPAAGSCC